MHIFLLGKQLVRYGVFSRFDDGAQKIPLMLKIRRLLPPYVLTRFPELLLLASNERA